MLNGNEGDLSPELSATFFRLALLRRGNGPLTAPLPCSYLLEQVGAALRDAHDLICPVRLLVVLQAFGQATEQVIVVPRRHCVILEY